MEANQNQYNKNLVNELKSINNPEIPTKITNVTDEENSIQIKEEQARKITKRPSIERSTAKIYLNEEITSNIYYEQRKKYGDNTICTTKYNLFTWFPKSLIYQFKKIANIYFLIITILTFMSFSPKNPYSQLFTFTLVLFFSMIKEAIEDYKRYKQDKEMNEKNTLVFDCDKKEFHNKKWYELIAGDLVKICKDEQIPADLLFAKSSFTSGLCFMDTKDLDGETNLKEKLVIPELIKFSDDNIYNIKGHIECDNPNEFLDSWEANLFLPELNIVSNCCIKQLVLKGSILRNTEYIFGYVVYCGHNTKIIQNSRAPPIKMSNIMRIMNKLLISVFIFMMIMCLLFAIFNYAFVLHNGIYIDTYITTETQINFGSVIIKFLTFVVAYSHLIPISLYVSLEVLKIFQSLIIFYDNNIYDYNMQKPSVSRTTDLIEELGQVQFIFSDKTGTLTQNDMEFKKCFIKGKLYGNIWEEDKKKLNITDDPVFFNINGDISAYKILSRNESSDLDGSEESEDKINLINFFFVATVCHSSVVEKVKNDELKYSSSSPDEVALIKGAKKMGFVFINRTSNTIEIFNEYSKENDIWEILTEIPFDSDRKRMSLIVKNINDNNYVYILTKGADSVMLNLIDSESHSQSQAEALYQFSVEGLRTLVLAMKKIDLSTFKIWYNKYKSAMLINSKETKIEMLENLYNEVENNLICVGISAIEDKLQEGVPETIELLLNSKIRIWVLTGDKRETALNIGRTCRLLEEIGHNEIDLVCSNEKKKKEVLKNKINKYLKELKIENVTDLKYLLNLEQMNRYYMIVDGVTLIDILNDKEMSYNFFKIGLVCRSVICCRVSPKQKAQVVKIAKTNGSWITMSVGDGANDVQMILEANIGVGIYGKEGTSAVRSADYAICQFKFLQRLVLVHGRNGYRRISTFICYYFYKNIILVLTEVYFVFLNGFSGQPYFPDWLPLLYNALWTSWPCILAFSLEKDVFEDKPIANWKNKNNLIGRYYEIIAMLYNAGHINVYFNLKRFWTWIIHAFCSGIIAFFSCVYSLQFQSVYQDGKLVDHWWLSTMTFCVIVHVVTYKIFLEITFWNKLTISALILSLLFFYACIIVINIPVVAFIIQPNLTFKVFSMLGSISFWIIIFTLPFTCLYLDIMVKSLSRFYNPTPVDLVQLKRIKVKDEVNIVKKLTQIFDPKDIIDIHKQRKVKKIKTLVKKMEKVLNDNED